MAHPAFYSMPQRRHEKETLKARFFHFANDLLVMDVGRGHVVAVEEEDQFPARLREAVVEVSGLGMLTRPAVVARAAALREQPHLVPVAIVEHVDGRMELIAWGTAALPTLNPGQRTPP